MINWLLLLSSIGLSAVSAFFSVSGLTAIFIGSVWPVIIMGGSLEIIKLVASSWLYRYWGSANLLLKVYLTFAITILVCISSLGIFGFLSRSHIEASVNSNNTDATAIAEIDANISVHKSQIDDYTKQIAQIDNAIQKMIDGGKANNSLSAATQQRKTRNDFTTKKAVAEKELAEMQVKKAGLDVNRRKIEAEVGPLKYVADALYGSTDQTTLEKAVRLLIIIFVTVFDPLAIVGLLAANHGFSSKDPRAPIEIEKIIEKIVDRPVEVEKIVEIEKIVDRPVEVIVEKIIEDTSKISAMNSEIEQLREGLRQATAIKWEPANHTQVPIPAAPSELISPHIMNDPNQRTTFGVEFPQNPVINQTFMKTDAFPTQMFKWNGVKWVLVQNDTFDKLKRGEIEWSELSQSQQESVRPLLEQEAIKMLNNK